MTGRPREGDDHIEAPFTSEQVDALNRFQRIGLFHEFTCIEHHGAADRTLFATVKGWRCPHCDYQQDWAHRFMLEFPQHVYDPKPVGGCRVCGNNRDHPLHVYKR